MDRDTEETLDLDKASWRQTAGQSLAKPWIRHHEPRQASSSGLERTAWGEQGRNNDLDSAQWMETGGQRQVWIHNPGRTPKIQKKNEKTLQSRD